MKKLLLGLISMATMMAFTGEVKFRGEEILVDGRPFLIRGGEMHPQYSLYCPASFLKVGENRIDIIEMDLTEPQPIRGLKENLVIENGVQTTNANNVW